MVPSQRGQNRGALGVDRDDLGMLQQLGVIDRRTKRGSGQKPPIGEKRYDVQKISDIALLGVGLVLWWSTTLDAGISRRRAALCGKRSRCLAGGGTCRPAALSPSQDNTPLLRAERRTEQWGRAVLFAGSTFQLSNSIRRGLSSSILAANIPAGSTIVSAEVSALLCRRQSLDRNPSSSIA